MEQKDLKIGCKYISHSGWGGVLIGFDGNGDPILMPNEKSKSEAWLEEDGSYKHTLDSFLFRYKEDVES